MNPSASEQFGPVGWNHNPSSFAHRWYIAILAAVGFLISVWLVLYQLGWVQGIWEPFFGRGSEYILRESSLTRQFRDLFQVPDSFAGAVAYLIEMLLAGLGTVDRWRTTPWLSITQGLLGIAMAVVSLLLVLAQAFMFHQGCTLCLFSAAISFLIVPAAVDELAAAIWHLVRAHRERLSLWRSFWGTVH